MLVHEFLENSAARLPEKVALICGERRLTYTELNIHADWLALGLHELGIRRQDRVVIFLDNSVETVVAIYGILKAGAIFVVINPAMKTKKLNYILRDSGARIIITHHDKARVVKEALNDLPDLDNIVWVGKVPSLSGNAWSKIGHYLWEDLLTQISQRITENHRQNSHCDRKRSNPLVARLPHRSAPRNDPDRPLRNPGLTPRVPSLGACASAIDIDLATIIYTSGSTGEPKGVMSAHYNVVAAAKSITQYLENTQSDIIINCLPLAFDYGLYQILMAALFGGTVVLERSFVYPVKVLQRISQEGVTGFPIVPTMAAILLQMKDISRFDLSSLRYISNTGAALPVAHIKRLQGLFPHAKLYSMYGLTECKRVSYLPPEELGRRPGSVGKAMPNVEVFIVNENGEELGAGEVGELVVRGSNVMQGYWNAPEETAQTFRPGRYRGETLLYTGDLFKKDEDGFLYFVARKDDLIKIKGERVSPKEIENAICEIEGVAEAAVIGVPDDILGHVIKAFVVARDGTKMTGDMIRRYCMKTLEPFMVPKYIEVTPRLPKSPSGKIDKKRLSSTHP